MQQFVIDQFHSKNSGRGGGQLPDGFAAVAIHPASEVDLCMIGGHLLGVGSVLALPPKQTGVVEPVRKQPTEGTGLSTWRPHTELNNRLVLQLFRDCDTPTAALAREPVIRSFRLPAASVPVLAADAYNVLRIPFSGRRQAMLRFGREDNLADLTVVVVGVTYGSTRQYDVVGPGYVEQAAVTWWNGGGAAPTISVGPGGFTGTLQSRQVYIGGGGDAQEAFDELMVFAYGGAGGAANFYAEAFGERKL